jgi:hypothetical protein
MAGQVVDTPSAQEFMREALTQITPSELLAIAGECAEKSRRFHALLGDPRRLGGADLRPVLRSVFAARRRADDLIGRVGADPLAAWTRDLLHAPGDLQARFQAFFDRLEGSPDSVRFDLASELLHFTFPGRHWLWTRWMWDPRTRTGALPLVTLEAHDLHAPTAGQTYLRVGRAVAFVQETGRAAGLHPIGADPFGVDVFLAAVYGVYVYTTVRMRMTQEFNRVIPPLPELCRRFLGVWKMEG